MNEEPLIHLSDGRLLSKFDIPGTKVKRKENLPYEVHSHFPVGEIAIVVESCNRLNDRQDPLRPVVHVRVQICDSQGNVVDYCFHPYRDTLEVVE